MGFRRGVPWSWCTAALLDAGGNDSARCAYRMGQLGVGGAISAHLTGKSVSNDSDGDGLGNALMHIYGGLVEVSKVPCDGTRPLDRAVSAHPYRNVQLKNKTEGRVYLVVECSHARGFIQLDAWMQCICIVLWMRGKRVASMGARNQTTFFLRSCAPIHDYFKEARNNMPFCSCIFHDG